MSALEGGSGVPDTGPPSIQVTSHTSFRPINSLTGKKEGGGGRDRKAKDGHKARRGEKKASWVRMEKDYRGREGGRIEVRRQSAVYFSLLSPGDGPGVNEGVKYSGRGQERRTLSDVKQLQRWDAARGKALLLKNAIRPSALIFI